MKEDALELLMAAYQQTSNQAKMMDTAQKVLQANPCNIRALALVAYTKQAMAMRARTRSRILPTLARAGEKGLQCLQTATKPDGTSDADWDKLKAQTSRDFQWRRRHGCLSMPRIMRRRSSICAPRWKRIRPTCANVYTLALAYLTPGPAENDVDGLFFIARAANLAQGAGKDQIAKFGKSKYVKYHGSEEGWTDSAGAGGDHNSASGQFHDHEVRAADSGGAGCDSGQERRKLRR